MNEGPTKANDLSNDQLEQFLELIRGGVQTFAAARKVDPPTSNVQIHRRASRDADFAEALREAKDEGFHAYRESIRAEVARQAFAGDYQALREGMISVDEEFIGRLALRHRIMWWIARRFPCRWVFGRKACRCGPQQCKRDL